jgi:hypothetical protein
MRHEGHLVCIYPGRSDLVVANFEFELEDDCEGSKFLEEFLDAGRGIGMFDRVVVKRSVIDAHA